jgi:hypothetical protein
MHIGHCLEEIQQNSSIFILYFENSDIKQIQIKMSANAYTNIYTCLHIFIYSFIHLFTRMQTHSLPYS